MEISCTLANRYNKTEDIKFCNELKSYIINKMKTYILYSPVFAPDNFGNIVTMEAFGTAKVNGYAIE